ncbi:helix-turn-helix transcriptional regulator [Catenuloplanes atrovinosus]|uniref:Transcriptional regulator with XRE-family HTH domain n=1 Tax=Catenuloplanes atrovinosus TaxID=137266 RepID=A0AAE3YQJ2_9ACTN|nr:helix-turn-helix transcriptional regulator [Catenuloplanes atrovinosus]MDR7275961.1 transcriptional regulator with XRE-family HTH domain [Catenuloplanes atrovinosus]
MPHANALGEFLRAHRERTSPADAGLPTGGRRRVPGLRRDEVAVLAGMSTDYYTRLEQGRERHPSAEILDAIARVLGLDTDATAHLHRLATRGTAPAPRTAARISPGLRRLLETWQGTPVAVQNPYGDVLACTHLAAAIHPGMARDRNLLRALFLDPAERDLYPDWEEVARTAIAWIRAEADPASPRLAALVGELSVRSPEFARLWARHDVRAKASGRKRFRHPLVGEFTVGYESFRGAGGQTVTFYHTAPDSPDADAITLLGGHADAEPVPGVTVVGR